MAEEKMKNNVVKYPGAKNLEEISAEEISGKEYIGTSYGIDCSDCVHLGMRNYVGDFLKEAKWYYLNNEPDEVLEEFRKSYPTFVKVDFYGEKTNK